MNSNEMIPVDIDEEMPIEPAKAAQYLLYVIAALVILTLAWASLAKLDRVTRGQGWVVTSNQLQELQYLEGGIVKEILVSAGDRVEAGDVLIKLDPTQMNVAFAQGQDGYNALSAKIARLEAEASMSPLKFPKELEKASPQVVANERQLYDARAAELAASLEIEQKKLDQRKNSLDDARVALETAKEAAILAAEEHRIMETLVGKGIEPQVELLRAHQRDAAARGEMQRAELALRRIQLEIGEAEGEIWRIRKAFSAKAADELNQAKAELEELKGELPALQGQGGAH